MSRPTDKEVADAEPPAEEPAGRVEFDSRGNSVWRWARDVLDNTSVLLKRLDNKDLALEPTRRVPVLGGAKFAAKPAAKAAEKPRGAETRPRHPALQREPRDRGGGFDPYNSR